MQERRLPGSLGCVTGGFTAPSPLHPSYCSPVLCTASTAGVHRSEPARLSGGVRLSLVGDLYGLAGLELVAPSLVRSWWPVTRSQDGQAWREIVQLVIAHRTGNGGVR